MDVELQRNVPLPPRRRVRSDDGRKKYPFDTMQVNDFLFLPHRKHSSIRSYFSTAGKQHGIKLRSEQIFARQGQSGWQQCHENAAGAVSGVGVWRIE